MYRIFFKRLILPSGAAAVSLSFFQHDDIPTSCFSSAVSNVLELDQTNKKQFLKKLEDAYSAGKLKTGDDCDDVDLKIWAILALEKSPLTRLHKVPKEKQDFSDDDFDRLLHRLELDKVWNAALTWYSVNVCGEDDLSCLENAPSSALHEKPSKIQKLKTLLQVLLYKTEFDSCRRLVNQGVLHALLNIFKIYNEKNKDVGMVVLKILSEIAKDGKHCAEAIVQSEWYPTLVTLLNAPVHQEEEILAHKIFVNLLFSFGLEDYPLPSSIYELHRPPIGVKPKIDIVFVHGLRGSVFRTWRQKDDPQTKTTRFWPRHWLSKDINAPVRILAVDYATRLLQFGQVMETVNDRSRKFQQSFREAGIGARPVVFVCHSMAGLLIKKMLLENENLRKNTVGILFMATPHKGSPVAGFAHSLLRPSEDVKFLKVESELNRQLNSDFLKVVKEVPLIVSTVEEKPTPMFGTKRFLVPSDSGYIGVGALYHINDHHHNICKPESTSSPSYNVILNFVRDALKFVRD
uniref:GPI inositol-deacylase n=1 Tax=Panagrolaimus sp. JU765 TaxID=591449 RepID=A0AC34QDB9_9BILA